MFGHVSNELEVKILPGHFGHTILLNQKAEKGTGHWLELLIPVTSGKIGLLLHNEEKEDYFWNSGDLLSCYYIFLPNYTGQVEKSNNIGKTTKNSYIIDMLVFSTSLRTLSSPDAGIG